MGFGDGPDVVRGRRAADNLVALWSANEIIERGLVAYKTRITLKTRRMMS